VLLAMTAMAASETVWAGPNFWTRLGPDNGTVTSFAIDPQNPTTVYAAACTGLFKTSDEGTTWTAVNCAQMVRNSALHFAVVALSTCCIASTNILKAKQRFPTE
jgi:hypothetical protein